MCIPQVVATSAAWSHLRPNFLGRLTKMRIIDPTPCQRQVLPALMPKAPSELAFGENARMAVIQWPTGSGKTLSYMLPMMERLNMHATGTGVQGLILVPTRVVGLQTMRTLRRMAGFNKKNSKGNQIKAMALLGDIDHMDGRKRRIMETELAHRTPDVAVGTPKMVRQLLENDLLPLHRERKGRMLVLDEVDSLAAPASLGGKCRGDPAARRRRPQKGGDGVELWLDVAGLGDRAREGGARARRHGE